MLTVVDMQNKEFKRNKIGGYNVDEVNSYMEEVIKAYQEIQNDNYALKDKVNVLNESVQYYRTMESTIQNVLVLADKTAQDTKAAAYEKAEEIKKEADERAEKITALAEERVSRIIEQGKQEAYDLAKKVEEVKRQYLAYKSEFKQLLQVQVDFLNQGDVRIDTMQDDLVAAFQNIQGDTSVNQEMDMTELEETHEAIDEDEAYFTREYMPVEDN